jgi:hypothetical protein
MPFTSDLFTLNQSGLSNLQALDSSMASNRTIAFTDVRQGKCD